ncbi:MAG: hypothetical protein MUP03_06855 [Anaerolineales bacterium]|nr:hypothetical protein [Anaerolineales bacterium]
MDPAVDQLTPGNTAHLENTATDLSLIRPGYIGRGFTQTEMNDLIDLGETVTNPGIDLTVIY